MRVGWRKNRGGWKRSNPTPPAPRLTPQVPCGISPTVGSPACACSGRRGAACGGCNVRSWGAGEQAQAAAPLHHLQARTQHAQTYVCMSASASKFKCLTCSPMALYQAESVSRSRAGMAPPSAPRAAARPSLSGWVGTQPVIWLQVWRGHRADGAERGIGRALRGRGLKRAQTRSAVGSTRHACMHSCPSSVQTQAGTPAARPTHARTSEGPRSLGGSVS